MKKLMIIALLLGSALVTSDVTLAGAGTAAQAVKNQQTRCGCSKKKRSISLPTRCGCSKRGGKRSPATVKKN